MINEFLGFGQNVASLLVYAGREIQRRKMIFFQSSLLFLRNHVFLCWESSKRADYLAFDSGITEVYVGNVKLFIQMDSFVKAV